MNYLSLAFFVLLSLSAGFVGSFFGMGGASDWYQALLKPSWTPPSWVFAPVWTVLYVLMGVAAYLVSRAKRFGRSAAVWLFLAHLPVNAFWSIAFFGMQEVLLAALVIGLLWFLILVQILLFRRYSKAAAWLMVPYLLWVTYASTLNVGILFLN